MNRFWPGGLTWTHYLVGVCPSEPGQPVAVAVVAQSIGTTTKGQHATLELQLRHLEEVPGGASLPDAAARVAELCAALDALEESSRGVALVLDIGVLGTILVDLLDRRMPVVVAVTGGAAEGVTGRGVATVPRREVAAGLLLEAQRGTFRTASSLPLAPRFTTALQGFRFRAPAAGGGDALEEARREADDALVLAAGLCVWQSTREVPGWKHAAVVDPDRAMVGDYNPHAAWNDR